jgi:ABC-type amino acid transport substrate-binding protein
MRQIFTGLIFYIFLLLSEKVEAESIQVVAPNWVNYTNKDGSGIYFDVIKHVYPNCNCEFVTSEFLRAKNQFIQNKADIFVGVLQEELPNALFPKWFLDTDRPIVAFYLNENGISDKSTIDFKNKSVAWMEGFNFTQVIDPGDRLYRVKQREAGFNLLLAKRVDYFIDYEHNFLNDYREKVSFVVLNNLKKLYIAFQNTAKGKKLAAQYDEKLLELRNDGTLKTIFAQEYEKSKLASFKTK